MTYKTSIIGKANGIIKKIIFKLSKSIDFINKKLINEATAKHPESPKKILFDLKLNKEKPNINPRIIKPYLISIIL